MILEDFNNSDTDPVIAQWLLKLHKGAVAGFNAKTAQKVLSLFPGWNMTKADFIKPSDELGYKDGFRADTAVTLERFSHWSKKVEPYEASLHKSRVEDSRVSDDEDRTTKLHIESFDAEEAKALHAKVAAYVVPALPDPKKAKPDQYFVMNLTDPQPVEGKDGETWVWSFDLFRKCKGYRITAPDGQHFDICGPTQVLGYGGTKDFAAFFKWALTNTDLEAAVNAKLGLSKHLKASERPRIPVGGQTIGTCAICSNQQVVRHGVMVLHGYQRPGHGYVIGNCFGVDYQPYEVSADACVAYVPVLEHHKGTYQQRLADLNAGKVTQFVDTKRNYRTGRDEQVVTKKGDKQFDSMLKYQISDTERQITYIDRDIAEMNRRITDWKPGTLRRVEGLPAVS